MLVCQKCGATYPREQEYCGLDGERLSRGEFPLIGRQIDRYRIEGVLGVGGMATVYRALHLKLDQPVAFKALHGHMASDANLASRFQREARVLSKLSHPNIVQVTDFGATPEGLLYMVMELLHGEPLFDRVRRDGPVTAHQAAVFLHQAAGALHRAHQKGFVHRDLKPHNLMVVSAEDGQVEEAIKVLDFGLVGMVDPSQHVHTQLTQEGMFLGTPAYMAPEQITGGKLSPETDLYALGVVAYWMLTGETPFRGDARELAHQHVTVEPPRLRLEYGGLTPIVMQLLQKAPRDRIRTAKALVRSIEETGLLGRVSTPSRSGDLDSGVADTVLNPGEFSPEPALVISAPEELAPYRRPPRRRWPWVLGLAAAAGGAALYISQNPGLPIVEPLTGRDPPRPGHDAADGPGTAATSGRGEPGPTRPARSGSESPTRSGSRARVGGSGGAAARGPGSTQTPGARSRTPEAPSADPGEAPSSPDPESTDGPASQTFAAAFQAADLELSEHLAQRAVPFSALASAAPQKTAQWGRWYRGQETADPEALQAALEDLKARADALAQAAEPEPEPEAEPETPPPVPSETESEPSSGPRAGEGDGASEPPEDPSEALPPEELDRLDRSLEKIITPTSTTP